MKIHTFKSFVNEDYFAGLSKSTIDKKKALMKKQAAMSNDDPDAYKELPGDTKGKKNLKTSKHTNRYQDLYGDNVDEAKQKQSTDKSPIGGAIETGLKNKSKDTGVPIGILRAVMRRGLAAWKSGHRPGAGQQQWGYARVNSFLTKGKGTWGKADADLAKEVRDGGHDKELKESLDLNSDKTVAGLKLINYSTEDLIVYLKELSKKKFTKKNDLLFNAILDILMDRLPILKVIQLMNSLGETPFKR